MSGMSTVDLAVELRESVRGITREQYDDLVRHGHLVDDKVELLRGVIVEMAAKGPPHDIAVEFLTMRFARGVAETHSVRTQSPWAASEDSQPEPDLAVVTAGWQYTTPRGHPRGAHLIVEVSASSLRRDLGVKAAIYAEAGAPAYWVVDLNAREVVVHTDPVDGAYASVVRNAAPAVLTAVGVDMPLADLFAFTFRLDQTRAGKVWRGRLTWPSRLWARES